MSLHSHDNDDDSSFGFLFLMPWWVLVPVALIALVVGAVASSNEAAHRAEWEGKAVAAANGWLSRALGGGEIVSTRYEKDGVFHFNAKTPKQPWLSG